MVTTNNPCDLLTESQAAEVLTIKPDTLRVWRCRGRGPRLVRIGRSCRYRLADLLDFINANVDDPSRVDDPNAA